MTPLLVQRTDVFAGWLHGLKDARGAAAIIRAIDKLGRGLRPDWRPLGGDVSEFRIDVGPGYRVYYTERDGRLVVLLCGGDKRSQQADIVRAKALAEGL